MSASASDGLYLRRSFLSPFELLRVLDTLETLSAHWTASQSLRLLGRGETGQIRPTDIAVQGRLDELRRALAPAALAWARACGFRLPAAPHLQMFPVRMVGDAENPAYQEPHVDSDASQNRPPICTNVFYARAKAVEGGDLALARSQSDLSDPLIVQPSANMIASFAGHRVHWVQPLRAGERVSVVINFY